MHELGVLRQIVKTVSRVAEENRIPNIRHIALEVGENSGFVPQYLTKLFPVAADGCALLRTAELRVCTVPGKRLLIKEIGY
ncbi:MAG: hydrogenase maturation nickel metallochaperone HypA [Clostridia bacterium]|nr:hydrogenase maturation nickel metallochaperone HypA [Clostridia bacterium]